MTKRTNKTENRNPKYLAEKARWDAIRKMEDDFARNEKLTFKQRLKIVNDMHEYVQGIRNGKPFDQIDLTDNLDAKKRVAWVLNNV